MTFIPLSKKMVKCVCGNDDLNRRILLKSEDVKDSLKIFAQGVEELLSVADALVIEEFLKEVMGDDLI